MLHPDYQYAPKLVTPMASMIASGEFDVVLGSRILGGGARSGGMPTYKYIANRGLTFIQNLLLRQKLSEYHTGYRAWRRTVLVVPYRLPARSVISPAVGRLPSEQLFSEQKEWSSV